MDSGYVHATIDISESNGTAVLGIDVIIVDFAAIHSDARVAITQKSASRFRYANAQLSCRTIVVDLAVLDPIADCTLARIGSGKARRVVIVILHPRYACLNVQIHDPVIASPGR